MNKGDFLTVLCSKCRAYMVRNTTAKVWLCEPCLLYQPFADVGQIADRTFSSN